MDAKGKPIDGEVVNGSAEGRAAAVRAIMARADARAGDLAPIIEDIRTSGVTSLNAGGKATWSASQVNSPSMGDP
jgi:hypothetical protein